MSIRRAQAFWTVAGEFVIYTLSKQLTIELRSQAQHPSQTWHCQGHAGLSRHEHRSVLSSSPLNTMRKHKAQPDKILTPFCERIRWIPRLRFSRKDLVFLSVDVDVEVVFNMQIISETYLKSQMCHWQIAILKICLSWWHNSGWMLFYYSFR